MTSGELERVVFFGTPEFALPTLEALCESGHRPVLVVTQPARPVGRGRRLQDPPVAVRARAAGLKVAQPAKSGTRRFRESIEALEPDVAVIVAYGQILTRQLLAVPRHGFINVHASLLPKYRGAAPIQAAIAAGDEVTGVTTMQVEPGLDSGPILLARKLSIGERETAGELAPRLAELGAELLAETLERLEAGKLEPRRQEESQATYAPRLTRADGEIDWHLPAVEIFNRLRAFTPWPGLTAVIADEKVKLLELEPIELPGAEPPGTLLEIRDSAALFRCGGGTALAVACAQRPGRKPVTGAELARSV